MMNRLVSLLGFVVILGACESAPSNNILLQEESSVLMGKWLEQSVDSMVVWEFDIYEVKWKGFSHFYKVTGDSLMISGMNYTIAHQSKNELKIINSNGKTYVLKKQEQ